MAQALTEYTHLNTNSGSAVTVKTGRGQLTLVSINTKGAAGNTLTLVDGSNTIAVIDTTLAIGTLLYDTPFYTNLQATLNGGATAADVTISAS